MLQEPRRGRDVDVDDETSRKVTSRRRGDRLIRDVAVSGALPIRRPSLGIGGTRDGATLSATSMSRFDRGEAAVELNWESSRQNEE